MSNAYKNYGALTTSIVAAASLLMTGCNDPQTVVPTNTDSFTNVSSENYQQANQILHGDYMFVIDYSYSMTSKSAALFQSVQSFAQALQNSGVDYHVGVVDGNFQAGSSDINSATSNDFVSPFLSADSSLLTDLASQIAPVGASLQPNEIVLLESARKTLINHQSDFIRSDAQLVLIFVSDEDDTSENYASQYGVPGDVNYYVTQYQSFKASPDYISARAIVAGMSSSCPLEYDYDKVPGTRLSEVATSVDPTSPQPLCVYNQLNLAPMAAMARSIFRPTTSYVLQNSPVNGTLQVIVNGSVDPTSDYTFNASTNTVTFGAGHAPGASQTVAFQYTSQFTLSNIPVTSSINVTVGGTAISQDPNNGWSYNAAQNSIELNGSAAAQNGAAVAVTYQVQ